MAFNSWRIVAIFVGSTHERCISKNAPFMLFARKKKTYCALYLFNKMISSVANYKLLTGEKCAFSLKLDKQNLNSNWDNFAKLLCTFHVSWTLEEVGTNVSQYVRFSECLQRNYSNEFNGHIRKRKDQKVIGKCVPNSYAFTACNTTYLDLRVFPLTFPLSTLSKTWSCTFVDRGQFSANLCYLHKLPLS